MRDDLEPIEPEPEPASVEAIQARYRDLRDRKERMAAAGYPEAADGSRSVWQLERRAGRVAARGSMLLDTVAAAVAARTPEERAPVIARSTDPSLLDDLPDLDDPEPDEQPEAPDPKADDRPAPTRRRGVRSWQHTVDGMEAFRRVCADHPEASAAELQKLYVAAVGRPVSHSQVCRMLERVEGKAGTEGRPAPKPKSKAKEGRPSVRPTPAEVPSRRGLIDPELDCLMTVMSLLQGLAPNARHRVLLYLSQRLAGS